MHFLTRLWALLFLLYACPAQADEAVYVTYGDSYAPFAWGEEGRARGIQVDFVSEVLERRMGLKVVHESCPWKRCQEMVASGIKDGFFTVPTLRRESYTVKSAIPFYETRFVIHTRVGSPFIEVLQGVKSLSDLQALPDLRHVYMLGSGWHEQNLSKMKRTFTVVDASMIPLFLVKKRADIYIEQAEMFRYQAKQGGLLDQVVTLDNVSMRTLGWHLFISRNSEHRSLMQGIDQELENMLDSGELSRVKSEIFRRYGVE